jgi:glycosyltransferase involved in cell wall biosynthesis
MPGARSIVSLSWTALRWPPVEWCGVDPDVVHVLSVSFPLPARAPAIYTLHDVMILTHPEWYGRKEVAGHRRALHHARKHASAFVADSAYTAGQAAELLDLDREQIAAIDAACRKAGVDRGRYIVAVGHASPRKNIDVLVRALAVAGSSLDGVTLLVAGPDRGRGAELHDLATRLGLADRVVVTGFVREEELPPLLAGAGALAHPAVDEGFGLPPLEAMASGTPTVVSTAGALPEVVGDAALLVEPRDENAWATALVTAMEDQRVRDDLVRRGRERAAQFHWARTAHETRAVWDRVLAGRT